MAQRGSVLTYGYNPDADICLWGYGGRYIGEPGQPMIFKHPMRTACCEGIKFQHRVTQVTFNANISASGDKDCF